ncbi:hypothetical protein [Glaciihabitans sp. UYNi722]|uniref:hypothetical protein n=1 Tax=Glaciihabitans sp. UYNi722 TaxID=3156344 RepID=UPI00339A9CBA
MQSLLPATIHEPLDDLMIELPQHYLPLSVRHNVAPAARQTIVVVPFERYKEAETNTTQYKRHRGSWRCNYEGPGTFFHDYWETLMTTGVRATCGLPKDAH